MRRLPKVTNYRALAGAISLLLVGIHLSVMSGFYFLMDKQSFEVFHTGWWWEIALNLQIVCYFLMFLCHQDRMRSEDNWRRVRAWFRFIVTMLVVSVPSFLLIVAARGGWFDEPPGHSQVVVFISVAFGLGVTAAYIIPFILSMFLPSRKLVHMYIGRPGIKGTFLYFTPLFLLALLAGIEEARGGKMHLILWPFFAYLQAGLIYFWTAFNPNHKGQSGLIADEIRVAESE